jgi:hypothetical protein
MTTTQPEIRQALPYVSQLKIVKRASLQVVNVKDQQGNDAQALMQNQPSIQVEITLYIVGANGSTEKAFRTPYTFYSRDFLQDILTKLNSIENPPAQVVSNKKTIQDRLDTETLWLEDVLAKANIPTLEGLWSDAFSESLDQFPMWEEPETVIPGIKVYSRQLEWDARLSYEDAKSVTVTMGIYSTAACTEMQPERKTLTFEDGASKRTREATIAQYNRNIQDRTSVISVVDALKLARAMPNGPEKTTALAQFSEQLLNQPDLDAFRAQLVQEKDGYTSNRDAMLAVTYGSIANLVSLPSIAGSIKSLVVDGIIATLKSNIPEWSELNMDLVASRFALPSVE